MIRVVLDHLHTPTPVALYEAFPPAGTRRILRQLAWRSTPTHGLWFHRAAVECVVLVDQCLDRRLPEQNRVGREVAAWEASRNADNATVHWQFTTAKARTRLRWLYPS
jgi:hypothetical protein